MRLETSVSKMGLRTLRCWTNDHFIKKQGFCGREARYSRVRNFRIFENLDFWRFDQCILYSFFARIFTVATRNFLDEANDGLCPNYMFYKMFDLFLFFFPKTLKFRRDFRFSRMRIFRIFEYLDVWGFDQCILYSFFCEDFHCGNEEFSRRSKWWFMSKLHVL